jgi:hypothetical protein
MEITLKEEIKTVVKLKVARFTKDYLNKSAVVEVIKCIQKVDTGDILKSEFYQNRVFRNLTLQQQVPDSKGQLSMVTKTQNDFDQLLDTIAQMGEESYLEKLLQTISEEMITTTN